ncbi:MAG TPA: tRNA pseudouridine(54/55) synthase Pus10, partial [Candidatus Poseidoniales archaeon]
RKRFGAGGSPAIKQAIVERISKNLIANKPSIKIVSEKPEIMALIDVLTLNVELDIRSHYLYGRYRKLERQIPQTRWPCRVCKERGCEKCNGTGQQYPHSVQSLIGDPLIEIYDSTEHAFHGMGREDID